jgi:hypothetical protein
MRKALVIYWFSGMTNSLMTMGDVTDFSEGLRELENAGCEGDFLEARARVLEGLEHLLAKPEALNDKKGAVE